MAQIFCKNITVGYENNPIITDLSFKVNEGDYLCILGENGSGKTTLLKSILGLHPLSKGFIFFGDGLKRNEVGYLPQQNSIQREFPATVKETVISGCLAHMGNKPFFTKPEKQHAKEKMEELGISHLKNRCFRELSGGQQQRVLLARALCATEKILLLDEPVSGLDPNATQEMYEIIKKLNNDHKTTIIMISHDTANALKYATHILHISNKVFFGTKEEYIEYQNKLKEEK